MRIGPQTATHQVLACFSLIFASASLPASACSLSSKPIQIGKNFSVQVVYKSKPLAGLPIELRAYEDSRVILATTTNESGLSEFINVKPGPYQVSIRHAAFPQSVEIVVDDRRTKAHIEKITLEWPGGKPLSVRSITGLLNAPVRTESPLNDQAHPTFGALGRANLVLSRAVSGEVIESQTASESGAFGFRWAPAGLYILHVEMAENASIRYRVDDGDVPIEIDPSAKDSTLNLFLYRGVCGEIGYENRPETATQ